MKSISLSQNKYAIVDDEDFDFLNKFQWNYDGRYASRIQRHPAIKKIRMHNQIMGDTKGFEIDHINKNSLDNRKENLRICSHAENSKNMKIKKNNTSGYKGVSWDKNRNKWDVRITVNMKQIIIGRFVNISDAINAYNTAAIKYHKNFASINKLD